MSLVLDNLLVLSVPVVSWLVWSLNWHADVVGLFLAELGELSSKLAKMKSSDLLIKVLWQDIHLLLIFAGLPLIPQLELGNHLVGERTGHHKAGVSSGTTQVHETALSQNDDAGVGLWEDPPVGLRLDGDALHSWVCLKTMHVNLIVKVTNVANNGIVLHLPHVVNHDDVLVTGGGNEDISLRDSIFQRKNLKAFHKSLEGTDWVNFSHNHS